ncbi:hypothetical protein WMY93_010415 [Mugilogobius chulae]|uniref:Transmembrane protein n=1 Tax=Mugilogobius chulae TaxID=88201 RepID=A0AAW0PAL6_9GOBI
MHAPPATITAATAAAGGEQQQQQQQSLMSPSSPASSLGAPFRLLPALVLVVGVAVVVQLLWGLTLTSFFLKLFIYVSFALFCFLAGSFVLLTRKSPLKVSCFNRHVRQSSARQDFFGKLMPPASREILDKDKTVLQTAS